MNARSGSASGATTSTALTAPTSTSTPSHMTPRKCEHCGRDLPVTVRSHARFCPGPFPGSVSKCAVAAWRARQRAERPEPPVVPCENCGQPRGTRGRWCSRACGHRIYDYGWQARRLGLPAEGVPRFGTFERDGWSCWRCGGDTLRTVDGVEPLAPVFDYVVPLHAPGSPGHTAGNIRTVHKQCQE